MKKPSYLLVDYGNTNIKIGIYDIKTNKLVEIHFINLTQPLSTLIEQFKKLNNYIVQKIFFVSTVGQKKINIAIKYLTNYFKVDYKAICKQDFKGILDLSNINKKVVIGNDLLLLALCGSKLSLKSAIFCFGTVYTCVITYKNQIQSVLLIPNIAKAINDVSNQSSISKNLLPQLFIKTIGLNTPDCFASGANLMIEGLVDNVIKTYKLSHKNVLISGGDSYRYKNINERFKVIDNLTLIGLGYLIKEKCW